MDMKTTAILMDPLDVLFFRDGRPFDSGDSGQSLLPQPRVLAGALRTHLMRSLDADFDKYRRELREKGSCLEAYAATPGLEPLASISFRGPWLYVDSNYSHPETSAAPGPLVHAPTTLVECMNKQGEPTRMDLLRPMPAGQTLPGWPFPGGSVEPWAACAAQIRPLWVPGAFSWESRAGYLDPAMLESVQSGKAVDKALPAAAFFDWEPRTGLAIDSSTLTGVDSMLYSVKFLRLRTGVKLYAEIIHPADFDLGAYLGANTVIPLGGEGRRVAVTVCDAPHAWHAAQGANSLLFLTPLRLPDQPPAASPWAAMPQLAGIAAGKLIPITGWDAALRAPAPLAQAAPAGSVLFFDAPDAVSRFQSDDALRGFVSIVNGGPAAPANELLSTGWNLALACSTPS